MASVGQRKATAWTLAPLNSSGIKYSLTGHNADWSKLLQSSSFLHVLIQPTDTHILDIPLTWFALKHYEILNSSARWFWVTLLV